MTIYDRDGNLIPDELQGISTSIELITPEKAQYFLDNMARNRHIKEGQMKRYETDLKNGDFVFCPSPIIINENGEMTDGQHRCRAVVESNEPFWGLVLYNVPDGLVVDKGAVRSTGDALYIQGVLDEETSRSSYIALARNYLDAKYGRIGRNATDAQIGRFINSYQDDMYVALSLSNVGRSPNLGKKAAVQSALFAAIRCGISCDVLENFMRVLNTGFQSSPEESPAIVLRNWMMETTSHGRTMQSELTFYTENAIKDFVNKKPRKQKYNNLTHVYINKSDAIMQ